MKKSKLFGMAAMSALMLGSCSTDEVVNDYSPENAIQFGTYVGRDAVSRGSIITTEGNTDANAGIISPSLREKGFGVFAYYTDNGDFTDNTDDGNGQLTASGSTPNFMYNQKVEGVYTESNGVKTYTPQGDWTYTPLKYWPNESGDKVSFFAYAPYTADNNGNFTFNGGAGLPTLKFKVDKNDVKKHEDLLWATPLIDCTKSTYGINEKVPFVFHHALARIGFEVQAMVDLVNTEDVNNTGDDAKKNDSEGDGAVTNGTLDVATTIVVKKVELKGKFDQEGVLKYAKENGSESYSATITPETEANEEVTYTLSASKEIIDQTTTIINYFDNSVDNSIRVKNSTYSVYGQSVTTAEAQLNADDSFIMIIPKNFTESNALSIKVTYDVITSDENLYLGYSKVENVIETQFTGINFEAGKAYTFSLHLGMSSVKLSATVDEWISDSNAETDYSVNVPLNTTTTNP